MKRGTKILLLVLVVMLLAGGYVAARYFFRNEDAQEDAQEVEVGAIRTDDIAQIEYLYGEDPIVLTRTEDRWYLESDKNYPVEQAYPATMASEAASLKAKRLISENAEDFDQYGLDEPSVAYIFTTNDGTRVTYLIGDYNAYSDGYYMNVAGTDAIYLISADFLANFDYGLTALANVPEMEKASTDEVREITMTLDGVQTHLLYAPDGLSTVYSDTFTWFFDERTPADSVQARALTGYAVSYSGVGCAAYEADADALSGFGLDEPVLKLHVAYSHDEQVDTGETDDDGLPIKETKTEDKTLELSVGGTSDNGAYYAKLAGSDVVYLIDPQYMQDLRDFDLASLRNVDVCQIKSEDISSVTITADGKKYTLRVDRTDESNPIYTLDKRQITAVQFNDLYTAVQGILAEGATDEKTDNSAQITFVYHTTRKGFETITLQLIPFDNQFYVSDLNGSYGTLINKRDVENIRAILQDLQEQ